MVRKIAILLSCLAMVTATLVGFAADPAQPGCYVAAPASVNEGATITVTVTCNDVTDSVFGFEFGTTFSGQATTAATAYTPGNFVTGATNSVLEAMNTLAQYAVSRTGNDTTTGDFTLGTYTLTADKGLTSNGSVTINLPAPSFKLSDIDGTPLTTWRQANPETTVTINDVSLAQLNGNVTVQSDGDVGKLTDIVLTVPGGSDYTQASVNAASYAFAVANREYTAATDPELGVTISADMDSHLACSKAYSLDDGANNAATKIGTIILKAGDVISVSGDTTIDIDDATAIGAQFGSSTPTGEIDANGSGTVDIFDLVHVGRNYGAVQGTC